MPTSSCIQHPKRHKFIIIRDHIRNLFNGDVCAAAVLSVFEYLTNGELDRLEGAGCLPDTFCAWVEISNRSLCDHMVGMFGKSAIIERLDRLVGWGILDRESPGEGLSNRYLLRFDRVNDLLEKHSTLSETSQVWLSENRQVPVQNQSATCLEPATPSKEEDLSCLEKKEEVGEEVESTLSSSPEDLVDELSRMRARAKGGHRLKDDEREILLPWLRDRSPGCPPERFTSPFALFLTDDYWRERKYKITGFIRQFEKYSRECAQNGNGYGRSSSLAENGRGPAVTHAETQPTPCGAPDSVNFPDAIQKWNEVVTAGEPVEGWTKRDKHLLKTLEDPEFMAALPKVLERCQAARLGNEEMTRHVNFRWLLKTNKAGEHENWYDVLHGSLSWATAKRGGSHEKSAGATAMAEYLAELGGN